MSSIGFIARFSSFDLLNKPDSADDRYSIFQPLLETLVHDNHRLYEMENRDKTNVLYRTLAALYELGGEFGYKSISIARKRGWLSIIRWRDVTNKQISGLSY